MHRGDALAVRPGLPAGEAGTLERSIEQELQELLLEQHRRQDDALRRFTEQTGRTLSTEQLDEEIGSRLRPLVERAVDERLARDRAH